MDPPLHKQIPVVFASALTFGLYFSTFLSCARWLLFADEGWRVRRNIKWPTVAVTVLIFVCNVVHTSWTLHWTIVTAWHAVSDPSGSYQVPEWASILSCTVANCNVLLADITVIYRCWVIYGRRISVTAAPMFLWFVAFLCNILQFYLQTAHIKNPRIGPYSWGSANMSAGPGIVLMPFWLSTILLNAYVSTALIWRIYQTAKKSKLSTSVEHFHFFIRVVSESGLLYFAITSAHFLSWFGKSRFATNIISVLNVPVVGIAFDWFLIRMAENKAAEAVKEATSGQEKTVSTIRFNGSPASGTLNDSAYTGTAVIISTAVVRTDE